jgi:hypothetical protein
MPSCLLKSYMALIEILSPLTIRPMLVQVVIVLIWSLPSVLGPSRLERPVDLLLCE